MKPIAFPESLRTLQPSGQQYSENVGPVAPLPVWSDGEQVVSCWRPSLRERVSILLFGRVWLAVLSGRAQPPALVLGTRTYFQEAPRA